MTLNNQEAQQKFGKIRESKNSLEFALSPQGFLLLKQEKVLDCSDYRLYFNGQYYRRQGFSYEASTAIPDAGQFLCIWGNGKFLGSHNGDSYEFVSQKKPLTDTFSLLLFFRVIGRIALVLADGAFAPEAFIITLNDKPENERFCLRIMSEIIGNQNPDVALKLTKEQEAIEDGQE